MSHSCYRGIQLIDFRYDIVFIIYTLHWAPAQGIKGNRAIFTFCTNGVSKNCTKILDAPRRTRHGTPRWCAIRMRQTFLFLDVNYLVQVARIYLAVTHNNSLNRRCTTGRNVQFLTIVQRFYRCFEDDPSKVDRCVKYLSIYVFSTCTFRLGRSVQYYAVKPQNKRESAKSERKH